MSTERAPAPPAESALLSFNRFGHICLLLVTFVICLFSAPSPNPSAPIGPVGAATRAAYVTPYGTQRATPLTVILLLFLLLLALRQEAATWRQPARIRRPIGRRPIGRRQLADPRQLVEIRNAHRRVAGVHACARADPG
eukprot:1064007-Prorocentrum_minimum.AAC.1